MAAVALVAGCLLHCDDDDPQSCESLGDDTAIRRMEIERAAENRECSTDADCVAVYHSLSCFADCGEPVAVSRLMEEKVAADVAAVEVKLCRLFEQRDCSPPIDVPCVPSVGISPAVCRNEKCELQPALLE